MLLPLVVLVGADFPSPFFGWCCFPLLGVGFWVVLGTDQFGRSKKSGSAQHLTLVSLVLGFFSPVGGALCLVCLGRLFFVFVIVFDTCDDLSLLGDVPSTLGSFVRCCVTIPHPSGGFSWCCLLFFFFFLPVVLHFPFSFCGRCCFGSCCVPILLWCGGSRLRWCCLLVPYVWWFCSPLPLSLGCCCSPLRVLLGLFLLWGGAVCHLFSLFVPLSVVVSSSSFGWCCSVFLSLGVGPIGLNSTPTNTTRAEFAQHDHISSREHAWLKSWKACTSLRLQDNCHPRVMSHSLPHLTRSTITSSLSSTSPIFPTISPTRTRHFGTR